jgi:flagellar hook-associated protein 3 FlgL
LEAAAYAIDPANDLAVQGSARGMADLTFDLPRDPQEWEFNLTGSAGSATITASLADGKYDDVVSEINLMTSVTGIVASYNATTDKLRLTDGVNGEIILKDIQIEGVTSSERSAASTVSFASLDGAENEIGVARILGDHDLIIGTLDNDIERAIAHFSVQQAFIGAQMSTADRQMDIVEKRQIAVSQEVADIGDADLAALVTELQAMLVNKDAAQQAFAKIGQQSLFDFIR